MAPHLTDDPGSASHRCALECVRDDYSLSRGRITVPVLGIHSVENVNSFCSFHVYTG
jgi:hypothetical protein